MRDKYFSNEHWILLKHPKMNNQTGPDFYNREPKAPKDPFGAQRPQVILGLKGRGCFWEPNATGRHGPLGDPKERTRDQVESNDPRSRLGPKGLGFFGTYRPQESF